MKRNKTRKAQRIHSHLKQVNLFAAGIDIGSRSHFVAVPEELDEQPVREFAGFTGDLHRLADWLVEIGIQTVAMESTGVYWIPVYEVLERMGFEVHLVNPRATKQVSGRKSDVLDCQWIWQLMSYGLLKGAFRPADEVCELRSYVRQRARLVRDRSRCVQHIQKALTEMNVQLANVLSDVTGKTGMRILRAIVAGERDGAKLAALRDGRVRADEETLARSLRGTWRAEHVFALAQAVERYDFFETQIGRCEAQILSAGESLSKDVEAGKRGSGRAWATRMRVVLHRMLGVDLTAIPTIGLETALAVASELGSDLSRFASCAHFCSWLQLAPGTRISGGKPLPGRAPAAVNRLGQALRVAATTARSSQSFIGASHRARLSRLDKPRAIKATAHQLARLIYAMLTRGEEYVERGIAHYEAVRRDRQLRALQRRAHHMGLTLIDQPS
jgi:transposase